MKLFSLNSGLQFGAFKFSKKYKFAQHPLNYVDVTAASKCLQEISNKNSLKMRVF